MMGKKPKTQKTQKIRMRKKIDRIWAPQWGLKSPSWGDHLEVDIWCLRCELAFAGRDNLPPYQAYALALKWQAYEHMGDGVMAT
jgi:hypothetical protein